MSYNGSRVVVGAGTLYAAPLGTTEPVGVTGAWPAGWVSLGYTDTGSDFDFSPKVSPVEVEEEYWPIRQAITAYEGSITFALAEHTAQNLLLAVNGGIGSSTVTEATGTNPDGSVWVEAPIAGAEPRVMIGWDSLPEGAIEPVVGNTGFAMPFGRWVFRQCLQTGSMKVMRRKGNNKATYATVFSLEKPPGVQPFRANFPAVLAS
jgi:hypothetical protein